MDFLQLRRHIGNVHIQLVRAPSEIYWLCRKWLVKFYQQFHRLRQHNVKPLKVFHFPFLSNNDKGYKKCEKIGKKPEQLYCKEMSSKNSQTKLVEKWNEKKLFHLLVLIIFTKKTPQFLVVNWWQYFKYSICR